MQYWFSPRFAKRAVAGKPNIHALHRSFMHNIKLTLLLLMAAFFLIKSGSLTSSDPKKNFSSSSNPLHLLHRHRYLSFSSKPSHENAASHVLNGGTVQAAAEEEKEKEKGEGRKEAEDEDDDLESGIDPLTPLQLEPKMTDWDEQRHTKNSNFAQNHSNINGDSILFVSGSRPKACDSPYGDHYLLKSMKNKVDYCRLHGINMFYNMAQVDNLLTDYWSKLPLLRHLMLSHPEIEWFWWMDSDAMFTDMAFKLPMEKYKDYNLVLHGWGNEVYEKKSWIGLNTGIFLLRNCQWSLDLIDAWAVMGAKGKVRDAAGEVLSHTLSGRPPLFEADDQSALVYLLVTTQKEVWGNKVFLEYSYCLHGYWDVLVDKFEELMENSHPGFGDDRWPFVTHFVGCKPCGNERSYAEERCLSQMERAFNFADNQVLQHYGFTHKDLSSFKLKRIRRVAESNPEPLQLMGANTPEDTGQASLV